MGAQPLKTEYAPKRTCQINLQIGHLDLSPLSFFDVQWGCLSLVLLRSFHPISGLLQSPTAQRYHQPFDLRLILVLLGFRSLPVER